KNSKITPKLHIQHLNEIKEQRNPLSRKGLVALLYFLSDKVGIIPHQKGSAYLFLEDSIICGIFYRNRTKNYTRYIYIFFLTNLKS
ncbi:hypothetical protein, partial [Streptococcus pseudopneumoniae]|uniref:hypothetical protein n=1 Tax=Streptococcus pseudopneumoniae TaxID=257758 RepID=UPI001C724F23